MFDLTRLRLLRELSQRGTMTAVAAASRLTPSAVSQQLATLAAEAGVTLFEPVGRRVQLTEAGLRLAAHAQAILDAVEAARLDMDSAATRPGGRLAVASFGSFAKSHVLPALLRARRQYPELDIVLDEREPVDALEALRTGRCDAAIIYAHSLAPRRLEAGLVVQRLLDEPILLALPRRFEAAPEKLRLGTLADCDWIGGAREAAGATLAERACAVAGFAPRITHAIDDYDLLLRMVAAGLGISFVPQLALDLHPVPGVVVRRPAGPALRRSISLVARPAVAASPAFRALHEALSAGMDRKSRRAAARPR